MMGKKHLRKNTKADLLTICLCATNFLTKSYSKYQIEVVCGNCKTVWVRVQLEQDELPNLS